MRVIAGEAKGRRLKAARRQHLRPTSNKVKEALFAILSSRIEAARILDLFGGTGGIGIEALSRGAGQVDFVESDPAAVKILKGNLAACGFGDRAAVHFMDAFRFIKRARGHYDLIFADPPYHSGLLKKLLPVISQGDIIRSNGLVVVEHFHKVSVPDKIGCLEAGRSYFYGDTVLTLYHKGPSLE